MQTPQATWLHESLFSRKCHWNPGICIFTTVTGDFMSRMPKSWEEHHGVPPEFFHALSQGLANFSKGPDS